MTEYWISKKQYWCKYCSQFIRDDAPSRKLHETGLKHQGSKERFIRDLYKGGNQAKREAAAEAAEMARINASAEAAYAHDTHLPSARPSALARLQTPGASSSRIRDTKPKDKWANYTSAKDLGFDDIDTKKSSYEIEQELKGRDTKVGAWEEVVEQQPQELYYNLGDGKRRLGEYAVDEEENGDTFKFQHRDKRPVRDPYEEDDWDPMKALGGLKVRVKEERMFDERRGQRKDGENGVKTEIKEEAGQAILPPEQEGALKREAWSGRLELQDVATDKGNGKEREGMVYLPNGGGWVKAEVVEEPADQPTISNGGPSVVEKVEEDVKPDLSADRAASALQKEDEDIKPDMQDPTPDRDPPTAGLPAAEQLSAATNLFKKRRPPPGGRKK